MEKSQPPVYYIPPQDVKKHLLAPSKTQTLCEFKGVATYWNLSVGNKRSYDAAWSYDNPVKDYFSLKGYLAFYVHKMDKCFVDEN